MKKFDNDKIKEALALLAYNRGIGNVLSDLSQQLNKANSDCSICALTEKRANKKTDDFEYVSQFFAAAILGENPQAFGLSSPPLSASGTGN